MKMAQSMMQNMSPDQIKELMAQAQDSKQQMDAMIRKIVAEEIEKRHLVTREEAEKMISK